MHELFFLVRINSQTFYVLVSNGFVPVVLIQDLKKIAMVN